MTRRVPVDLNLEVGTAIIRVTHQLHVGHIDLRHLLQPYRSPNPRRTGIIATMRVEASALFPARLASGTDVILRTDGNYVLAGITCEVISKLKGVYPRDAILRIHR